jgi:hypothetical protein
VTLRRARGYVRVRRAVLSMSVLTVSGHPSSLLASPTGAGQPACSSGATGAARVLAWSSSIH